MANILKYSMQDVKMDEFNASCMGIEDDADRGFVDDLNKSFQELELGNIVDLNESIQLLDIEGKQFL